jgi:hypothetical protein
MALACPVCKIAHNSSGSSLESAWAVSCHIGGKARAADFKHLSWVIRVAPSLLDLANPSLPDIARRIEAHVQKVIDDPSLDFNLDLRSERVEEPYDLVKWIEESLHAFIRDVLVDEYGLDAERWWRDGVPLDTRRKCAARREEDAKPQEHYAYVDLIDLKDILDKRWQHFEEHFSIAKELFPRKPDLMSSLTELNEIRKRVMHPARRYECDEEDWSALRRMRQALQSIIQSATVHDNSDFDLAAQLRRLLRK